MSIKRCEQGHFYNDELYTACPSCYGTEIEEELRHFDERGKTEEETFRFGEHGDVEEEIFYFDEHDKITDKDSAVRFVIRASKNGELINETWGFLSKKAENEGPVPLSVTPEDFDPLVGWLVCMEGREKGRDYHLYAGRNFIGRSEKSEIVISDDDLITNENHASVIYDPKSLRFIAMPGESMHMTLNGEELNAPRDLKDGDMIMCGKTKLCFIAFCKKGRIWEG